MNMRSFKKIISTAVISILLTVSVLAQSTVYYVKSGDTMWKIAQRYQITVSELQKANPQANPNTLRVGQKLTIPNASNTTTYENQVITLVNQERARRGLVKLTKNSTMCYVARLKSQDMISRNYFSHISPTYGSPFTMMQHFGIRFSAAGENIAYGQQSPQAVMTAWMNSPGHRANILSASYNQIGVGCAKKSNGQLYWTQEFIRSM